MFVYTYSYKTDTLNEIIGRVQANDLEDAVLKISDIKRLCIDDVLNLFNIERIEQ